MEKMEISTMNEDLQKAKIGEDNLKRLFDSEIRNFNSFLKDKEDFINEDEYSDQIREDWALVAYYIATKLQNGEEVSEKEEKFYKEYFTEQLLKETNLNEKEKLLKSLYIQTRLSSEYEFNKAGHLLGKGLAGDLDNNGEKLVPYLNEYQNTLLAMLQETIDSEIKVVISEGNKGPKYNAKTKTLFLSKEQVELNFINYYYSDYDKKVVLDFIYKCSNEAKHAIKEIIRHDSYTMDALIYSIEHGLNKKNNKAVKISRQYKKLMKDIISNSEIDIDSAIASNADMLKLINFLKPVNEKKDELELLEKNYQELDMDHYIADGKYFDTNNLDNDAFEKTFNLFFNNLKSTPKTNLTNSVKLFAVNGSLNTIIALKSNLADIKIKLDKEKDEDKKAQLQVKYDDASKLVDLVTSKISSYQIEQEIMDLDKLGSDSEDEYTDKLGMLIDICEDDYLSFKACETRLVNYYHQLGASASSNSNAKVSGHRFLRSKIAGYLETVSAIQEELDRRMIENGKGYKASEPLKIKNIGDENALLVALQNFTGKTIAECEDLLEKIKEEKQIDVLTDKSGWYNFYKKVLETSGVEFEKTKEKRK